MQDIYVNKKDQLLIKISASPVFDDAYLFTTYEEGMEPFDPTQEISMVWYRLDEVRKLEEHEIIMYKLAGKI